MKFVPNALTIGRIVLTPVLLALLFWDTLFGQAGALALFVLAALSDYYDGKLARAFEARSRLGHFLDPFADKVLVLGTFTALAFVTPAVVPWWAVVLIGLRDVAVTALRTWAASRGRTLRTIPLAKTKTTVQLVFLIGMLVLLTARHLPGVFADAAGWVLASQIPFVVLMGVVALTVVTGLWYFLNRQYVSPAQFNP